MSVIPQNSYGLAEKDIRVWDRIVKEFPVMSYTGIGELEEFPALNAVIQKRFAELMDEEARADA